MESQQAELKKVHKGKWIPNALTISRLIIAIAIVLVLLIKPYSWGIDKDEGGSSTGLVSFVLEGVVKKETWEGLVGYEYTYASFLYGQFIVAGALFIVGCLTDFLDGFLSRKYNWVSDFGKIMDPVADKVLVDATLIVLTVYNLVFVWIVIIIVARDILVDATRMVKAKEGKVVPANIWGKCKTVFQMIGVIEILFVFNRVATFVNTGTEPGFIGYQDTLGMSYMYNPAIALANIGLYLALIFSVTSGIIYEIQMLGKPKAKKIQ